jgi:RHS repeat-associated protein
MARFMYRQEISVPELMVKGGRTYRLINDQLGSVRLVVDTADGTIMQEMRYDAWGNVVLDTNPGFQPFGFAGGLYDPQTRLVRFGARDYDASIGRWMAKDPILFASREYSLFSYVRSDPANLIDASGLCSQCDECPCGLWRYRGFSAMWAVGFGFIAGDGTFECVCRGARGTPVAPVKWGCALVGAIAGVGAGHDRTIDAFNGNFAQACNREDLYGRCRGFLTQFGPTTWSSAWSASGNFCGTILGLGASIWSPTRLGAGLAYIDCFTSQSEGRNAATNGNGSSCGR